MRREGTHTFTAAVLLTALALWGCSERPEDARATQEEEAQQRRQTLCQAAKPLEVGGMVQGNTSEQRNDFSASCGASAGGPDDIYAVTLQEKSLLRLHVRARHHAVLHLHSACPEAGTELTCTDHYEGILEAVLDPGRYLVVVDGQAPSPAGPYQLSASAIPVAPEVGSEQACGAAVPLPTGEAMAIDVTASSVRFPGECMRDRPGTVLHRLSVEEPTRIALRSLPTSSRGAVSVQKGCGDTAEELICERFEGDGLLTLHDLAPGDYTVAFTSTPGPAPFGPVSVVVATKSLREIGKLCEDAAVLRDARTISGENHNDHGLRRPPCNAEIVGTETVYRLNLESETPVTIVLESATDAAIYLRQDCNAPSGGEVACESVRASDQALDLDELERLDARPRQLRMSALLAEGSYWVYVDSAGSFRITAYTETRPPAEEPVEPEEPEAVEEPAPAAPATPTEPAPGGAGNPWQGPAGGAPTAAPTPAPTP